MTSAQAPREENLNGLLVVLFGKLMDIRVINTLNSRIIMVSCVQTTDRTVSNGLNIVGSQPRDKILLRAFWVQLDLVDGGFDLAVGQHVSQNLNVEVRNTDASCEAFFNKTFHLSPEFVHRNLVGSMTIEWPVNQVKINVIRLQLL